MATEDTFSSTFRKLEETLLEPDVRQSPARASALLSDDFFEIGCSGRTYDKEAILQSLSSEHPSQTKYTIDDFSVVRLGDNLVQARYRVVETKTLRSSLWRNDGDGWKIIFHQGTKEWSGN